MGGQLKGWVKDGRKEKRNEEEWQPATHGVDNGRAGVWLPQGRTLGLGGAVVATPATPVGVSTFDALGAVFVQATRVQRHSGQLQWCGH